MVRSTRPARRDGRSKNESGSLLGRDRELAWLLARLAPLSRGKGALIAVEGPAGIGKTSLLQAFAAGCRSRGMTVLAGGADAGSEPYAAWRPALRAAAGAPLRSTAAYRQALDRLCGGRAVPPPLPTEQTRYRLYDAVRERLVALTQRAPVLLLLDDAESMDEPSVRLLRHLLPFLEEMPVLAAVACDDRWPAESRIGELALPPSLRFDRLALPGLPASLVADLLRQHGLPAPDAAICRRWHEVAAGNPLHLELLARLAAGPATGDAASAIPPRSPERAVATIAARLPAETRRLLHAAAILGDRPAPASAAAVAGMRDQAPALAPAVAAGLLAADGTFRHRLVRQVLLAIGDPVERMTLERQAAERARGATGWQRALWYHRSRALPGAEAGVAACRAAAHQADADSAPESRAAALRMAADLAAPADRILLLQELASAAAEAGDAATAAAAAWSAAALIEAQPRHRQRLADHLTAAALALHDAGAEDAVWRPLQKAALARLGKRHDIRWARLRLLEPGRMRKVAGPPLQVGRWLGLDPAAMAVARARGDELDYCRTLLVYEWLSVADVDALLQRARAWREPLARARALSVAAETLMYRHGAFDRACRLLLQQLALHEARGSIVEQAKSLVRLTMAQLAAGELEAAVATRTRARDMGARLGPGYLIYEHAGTRRGGDLYPEISMESNFAWYLEGNWEAVAEHWVKAIALEEPGGSPVHIVEAAMAAQAFARLDRFAEARRYLDALTPVLQRLKPRDWALNGAIGRASHAIWDLAGTGYAAAYRKLALSLLGAGVGDWTNTSLELTVARMAALLGRRAEAEDYFRGARQRLGRKAHDPRRAIIDHDEAVALRLLSAGADDRRGALIASALATFRQRGMQGWVRRAEAEVGRRGR
ncbi:MAG: AAA family ATPase [Dongiaceae bacterium]